MAVGVAVVSAVIPGVLWLWVFTHGRSYRGAPLKALLITFLLGMLSTIAVAAAYLVLLDADLEDLLQYDIAEIARVMFFIVGPVEETAKFLAVRIGVYRTRHLREPLDGLIYGASASLGFATAENIGYALSFGPEVMIVRGPVSTVAHVVFGSLWAITLNPAAPPTQRKIFGVLGLTAAAALHGTFNVLAFSATYSLWAIIPAFGLVAVGAYIVVRTFRRVRRTSTYHLRRNVPLRVCPACSTAIRERDNFCVGCGRPANMLSPIAQRCANCDTETGVGVKFCSNCGDLFVYD